MSAQRLPVAHRFLLVAAAVLYFAALLVLLCQPSGAQVANGSYLQWATRDAPASYPQTVTAALAALADFPQYPKVEVQGSPRIVPGVLPHLCQPLALGAATPAAVAAYAHWCDEETQRHLPAGPGDSPFFAWKSGAWAAWPQKTDGGVVPTTLWDAGHLTVDQLLAAMSAAPDLATRKRAAKLADALRIAVYGVTLDPEKVKKQGQALSGNARAAGWTASFAVRMQRALPSTTGQDVAVMSAMVDGLYALVLQQRAAGILGLTDPFVPVNPADEFAPPTDDHGGCGWSLWMIEGPYLRGLCEIREFGTNDKLDALIGGALDLGEMGFTLAKADGKPPGTLPDDMSPVDPPHYLKNSALTPWCLMGLRAADAQGLLSPALKADAVALRDKTTWLHASACKPGIDFKNLSLLLLVGDWLGWN
jgi:hypothetical protein